MLGESRPPFHRGRERTTITQVGRGRVKIELRPHSPGKARVAGLQQQQQQTKGNRDETSLCKFLCQLRKGPLSSSGHLTAL